MILPGSSSLGAGLSGLYPSRDFELPSQGRAPGPDFVWLFSLWLSEDDIKNVPLRPEDGERCIVWASVIAGQAMERFSATVADEDLGLEPRCPPGEVLTP